ncbi:hypothetical protein F5146DRAFT_1148916 [Armillaria mellea]|nr:hypothetical protein F5146DRAFT_1148916 [Armillaria mellea]
MLPISAGYPIERSSGSMVVACLLHWGLFGTLSLFLSTDLYYLAFPKDRKFTKFLIYGIYIVEIVQTILITQDAFSVFGYGFGDLEALTNVHFSWLVPIMSGISASVGQGFYAYRIFILSRSRIVPAFIICVSLASFVASIVAGVCIFQGGDITKLNNNPRMSISIGISCVGYALCNIAIAICMTYYLMRSKPGFRRTKILVTKLIRLIIETGSLTAVVALVILILFFPFPHQVFYVTPAMIISKLYANTMYMVLNLRIQIMGGWDTYTSSTDMEITSAMMRDITSHSTQGEQRTPVVAITKEVFSSDDELGRMSAKPWGGDMSLLA